MKGLLAVGLLALMVVTAACGSSAASTATRGAAGTPAPTPSHSPTVHPLAPSSPGGQPLVSAADPPATPPTATLHGVRGTVIYEDWALPGHAVHRSPDDLTTIPWTTTRQAGGSVTIQLATTVLPTSVELLWFTAVDSTGHPTDDGRSQRCGPAGGSSGCRLAHQARGVTVQATPPAGASYLLVGADWFVPSAILDQAPGAAVSDSVKYAFRLQP